MDCSRDLALSALGGYDFVGGYDVCSHRAADVVVPRGGGKQLIQLIRLMSIFKPQERVRERDDLDATLKAVDNDKLVVLDQNLITE